MKALVVLSIATVLLLTGVVCQSQTPRHKTAKNEVSKPANDTMRICQGVPVPAGYTIVGYLTWSVCPHGAYMLKKHTDYEAALSTGRNTSANDSESSQNTTGTSISVPRSVAKPAKTSNDTVDTSAQLARGSVASTYNPWAGGSNGDSAQPAPVGVVGSRPRRVADSETNIIPPTLGGASPPRALGPPTLSPHPAGVTSPEETAPAEDKVSAAGPEEVAEGDTVRIDTSFVSVPVSVLDRQGRFIPNLKREDFSVFENGVEQAIAFFEPAEKPFTVALLLDASPSTQFHLSEIKEAAIAFAKQLRPQDRVLIITFSDEVLLLTEATNDMTTITEVVLANVREGNSTRLYDAMHLAIKERMDRIPGRKAMVLFTDGVDTGSSMATYQSSLEEAEELDTLIYPIKYDTTDYMRAFQNAQSGNVTVVTRSSNGPFGSTTTTSRVITNPSINGGAPLPGTTKADYDRADQYLHALADRTAGRLFLANDTTQLSEAFTKIAQELRWQYSIGYYPKTPTDESGERRQIRVRVRKPDVAVKARDSYLKSAPVTPSK